MARRLLVNGLLISSIVMAAGAQAQTDLPFAVESITSFDEPWALAFLPDGRMLVTEQKGTLFIVTQNGEKSPDIDGVPDVAYGGQGGLGDVALHPDFIENNVIYLSYAESGVGGHTRGAAVVRAVLNQTEGGGDLSDVEVIWRQYPKVVGFGHYGHRLLFDDEGYLWISSGDRQKFTPAQDMQTNLGKVLRLHDDGSVPDDNPFVDYFDVDPLVDDDGIYGQIWSLGHRNVLGLAIDLCWSPASAVRFVGASGAVLVVILSATVVVDDQSGRFVTQEIPFASTEIAAAPRLNDWLPTWSVSLFRVASVARSPKLSNARYRVCPDVISSRL